MAISFPTKTSTGESLTTVDHHKIKTYSDANKIRIEALGHTEGVISGLAISEKAAGADMSVDYGSGYAVANGTRVDVAASGNVVVTAADATDDRIDIITINSSGTVSVTAGTPASGGANDPIEFPALPSNECLLAYITVSAGATSITTSDITDQRNMIAPFFWKATFTYNDEVTTSSESYDDMHSFTLTPTTSDNVIMSLKFSCDMKVSNAVYYCKGRAVMPDITYSNDDSPDTTNILVPRLLRQSTSYSSGWYTRSDATAVITSDTVDYRIRPMGESSYTIKTQLLIEGGSITAYMKNAVVEVYYTENPHTYNQDDSS